MASINRLRSISVAAATGQDLNFETRLNVMESAVPFSNGRVLWKNLFQ